jgi:hypothetical protein
LARWRWGTEAGEEERRGSEEAGARAGRRAITRRWPAANAMACQIMGNTTRGHHRSRLSASAVVLTLANSRHGVNK